MCRWPATAPPAKQSRCRYALRAVVPEYARANVSLAIENHDRFPAASLAAMVEQIDSRHVGMAKIAAARELVKRLLNRLDDP